MAMQEKLPDAIGPKTQFHIKCTRSNIFFHEYKEKVALSPKILIFQSARGLSESFFRIAIHSLFLTALMLHGM